VGDHAPVAPTLTSLPVSRRTLFLAAGAVAFWIGVGFLPWWRIRDGEPVLFGREPRVDLASVWQASTPGSLAVLVAAVTTAALLLAAGGRWAPRTRAERAGVLAAVWLLPALLLLWMGWTVNNEKPAEPGQYTVIVSFDGHPQLPAPSVARDHLGYEHSSLRSEGPAWGLQLGLVLMLALSVWATARALRSPAGPAVPAVPAGP
jgi:hypothetical protein